MFAFINDFLNKRHSKHLLLPFYTEIKANLERFWVMDQRQFIDGGFQTQKWDQIKLQNGVQFGDKVKRYTEAIVEFNTMFDTFKEYERWYASDLKNKTPENAKKLHSQKSELDRRLKTLDEVIIPAGEELERMLIDKRILK